MPDSIFYISMGWGMIRFFFWFFSSGGGGGGGNRCLPQHRRDGFSLITITPVGVGKP